MLQVMAVGMITPDGRCEMRRLTETGVRHEVCAVLQDGEWKPIWGKEERRKARPDYDLLADIAREEAHDRYVEMGERERYGY